MQYDFYYTSPSGRVIPVIAAKGFKHKFLGLTGYEKRDYGLLLEPCKFVHTFFIKYPVDIIYLDKNNKVITTKRYIKPFRISLPVPGAKKILKFPSSLNAIVFLKEGTNIELSKTIY